MTITEFLLARIAEDEAAARAAINGASDDGMWTAGTTDYDECRVEGKGIIIYDEGGHTPEQARHIARHDPSRVLAQCEAKRRIVAEAAEVLHMFEGGLEDYGWAVVRHLASVYADHPDYREEWKP